MRELVGGKNTIGRTAAMLKKLHKATFNLFFSCAGRTNFSPLIKIDACIKSVCEEIIRT